MSGVRAGSLLFGVICLLLGTHLAMAQTASGVITGRVVDPSGLAIPGASVTLTSETTGDRRQAVSADNGEFVFPAILPGSYSMSIEAAGMKRLEKKNVNISASERLATGDLNLEVGTVTDAVEVTAQGAAVQTESEERSSLLSPDQLQALATKTRLARLELRPHQYGCHRRSKSAAK
jgi:hypothetical protein